MKSLLLFAICCCQLHLLAQNLTPSKKIIDGKEKYGFLNDSGAVAIDYKFDAVDDFIFVNEFTTAYIGNTKYWIDKKGQLYPLAESLSALTPDTKALVLEGRNLTSLPQKIQQYPQLEILVLEGNKLRSLPKDAFANLKNLRLLDLDNNKITQLDKDIFQPLPKLEFLYIAQNRLTNLPEDIFHNLLNLKQLWFYTNKITSLHTNLFKDLSQLEYLSFASNKINNLNLDCLRPLLNLKLLELTGYKNLDELRKVLPNSDFTNY